MKSKNIILDVGANYGGFSLEIAKRNPESIIYAIEAEPGLADYLKSKQNELDLPNHITECFAVCEENGKSEFYVSELGDHGTSSLLPFSQSHIDNDSYWADRKDLFHSRAVEVETKRLDTFLDTVEFKEIDFIKIDVQGLDLSVLRSAGNYLEKIRAGMLEVPAITDKSLYENTNDDMRIALNYLFENGFQVYSIKPNDEASNEFNIYFIRNGENIHEIEQELNLQNFHFYDGKNFWHAPSHKLEFPEQHIINLNAVL
ncbi:FkbM family methyltransferase, partial [Rahnella sp. PD12R]|uniref:FkbM family methyltransferase n=1 Tax=Rahnella sp. PD12R TaxID=2855688 RepID=UPI001C47F44E